MKERRELKIRIEDIDTDAFNLTLNTIFEDGNKQNLGDLLSIPDSRREWSWLVQTLNFRLGSDCSKEYLAKLLLEFASWTLEEQQSLGKIRSSLPWPILACIEMAPDSNALCLLADAALKGKLGDRGDWQLAEDRWKTLGVTAADFYYIPEDGLPFDRQIAQKNYPFILSGASVTHKDCNHITVQKLFEIWRSLGPSLAKKKVAYYVLFVLSISGEKGDIWEYLPITDMEKLVADRHQPHLYWTLLASLPDHFWEEAEAIKVLQALGESSLIVYGRPKKMSFITKLELLVAQNPEDGRLLRLLSIACLIGYQPSTLVNSNPDSFNDVIYQAAALIIKVAQADWLENDKIQLAEKLIALGKLTNQTIETTLEIIETHKMTGRSVELLLTKLYLLLPYTDWEIRRDILLAIQEQQGHRLGDVNVDLLTRK